MAQPGFRGAPRPARIDGEARVHRAPAYGPAIEERMAARLLP